MKGTKKKLSIDEKFANAEKILADKEINVKGKELFEKVIKKAVKKK
jgi:hypothetical protein